MFVLKSDLNHICCFYSSLNIFSNQFDHIFGRQSIIFSEMERGALKSELLFEDSGHSICCFWSSLNIFPNQFDYYCLLSINFFLRNEAWSSQKQTFARRQWAQHLLFFVLLSTSCPINLITIVCCQSIVFSEMETEVLKSEVSLEDSEHNICCFFSYLNIFSNRFVKNCGENVMFEEKVTLLSFYCNWEKVFLVFLKKCYKKWFVGFSTHCSSIVNHEVLSIVDHQCLSIAIMIDRSSIVDR